MRVSPRLVASLAAIAIAGGIVVVGRDDDGRPSAWDERVVELVEFVEDERGHRFEHPVPVDFLDERPTPSSPAGAMRRREFLRVADVPCRRHCLVYVCRTERTCRRTPDSECDGVLVASTSNEPTVTV